MQCLSDGSQSLKSILEYKSYEKCVQELQVECRLKSMVSMSKIIFVWQRQRESAVTDSTCNPYKL